MAETSSRVFRFCVVLSFVLMAVPITLQVFGTHDWQRIFQIVIAVFLFLVLLVQRAGVYPLTAGRSVQGFAAVLLLLGFVSVALAHQPTWALAELSLVVACVGVSLVIAQQRLNRGVRLDSVLIVLVASICALKCIQFLAGLLAAFISGFPTLDIDILFQGFSNTRFYGQFQTFTLPLLALPLMSPGLARGRKIGCLVLLCCWWMIAISSGTRGTWLGMAGASVVMGLCGAQGRRWLGWQALAAFVGLMSFWCFLSLLPRYMGIEVTNFAGDRLTTSLSARDILWHQAWEMIKQRPLLGFGPMHFADMFNPVAAHPHQALLQWACEWGVPATLFLCWLVYRGSWATMMLIRRKAASTESVDLLRVGLFASLAGALAQSMVDGVIVMPYSQLWLAIVTGWLIGIHDNSSVTGSVACKLHKVWLALFAAAVGYLGYVLVRDVPHLEQHQQAYIQKYVGRFQPRFWAQGVIAEPSDSLLGSMNTANFSTLKPK